jgi:hypothetical protein
MAKNNSYAKALLDSMDEGSAEDVEEEYGSGDGCLNLPKDFFGAFPPKKGDNVNLSFTVKASGDTIKLMPESFSSHKPFKP